jgi:thioredoxin-related protein
MSVWSLCFVTNGETDSFGAAMGLVFTFTSAYFVQEKLEFNLSWWDKVLLLAFPVFYLAALYYVLYDNGVFYRTTYNFIDLYQILFYVHLINPVLIAMLVLLLNLSYARDLKKAANVFVFLSISFFYSYFFFDNWEALYFKSQLDDFSKEETTTLLNSRADSTEVNTSQPLTSFQFINYERDTIRLNPRPGNYILLETWNESCFPCIKAMNELPPFYRKISDKVDIYYVYESRSKHSRNQFDKVFNFKSIQSKSHILIDIQQDFYNQLEMKGYPYFLLFDSNGDLVYQCRGYAGKEVLQKEILEAIN